MLGKKSEESSILRTHIGCLGKTYQNIISKLANLQITEAKVLTSILLNLQLFECKVTNFTGA